MIPQQLRSENHQRIHSHHKGFSLIELMIALSIIGILTGLLVPNFNKLRMKSKQTATKSVVHSLQIALESYAFDKGSYPKGNNQMIIDVVQELIKTNDLNKSPKNPYTGQSYTLNDSSGKIIYSATETSYQLTAYGQDNKSIIYKIDH